MCFIFCAYLRGLVGQVWRGFWLKCILIRQDGDVGLICCVSPGFHFGGCFKWVCLCHCLSSSFSFFSSLAPSLYFVECCWLCVWCECVWRAKAEPAEDCAVFLPILQGSKWRWLPTTTLGDKWSITMCFIKTKLCWFYAAFTHAKYFRQSLSFSWGCRSALKQSPSLLVEQ